MKRSLILISVLLGSHILLSGQNNSQRHSDGVSITGQLQVAVPQDDFSEVMNGRLVGGAVGIGLPMGRFGLFRIGGEYAWSSIGEKRTSIELRDYSDNLYIGDLDNSTDINQYTAYIRFAPFKGGFRPYGDLILGGRSYSSTTDLTVEFNDGSYAESQVVLDRKFQSTYGYAAGVQIGLGRHAFIDARLQVLRGGNVSFIDQDNLRVDSDAGIAHTLKTSETDMIIPQIGLTIGF